MKMIKVELIKNDQGHVNITATCTFLLGGIFLGYHEDNLSRYNGVMFRAMTGQSLSHPQILGIIIEAGHYKNMLRRRVMIKDGMIDADAIRAKYEECEAHVAEVAQQEAQSKQRHLAKQLAFDTVIKELGINPWQSNVFSESETTVKMQGRVDWIGLKAIQDTLGTPMQVDVTVSVPVAHATAIYNILKE